MRAHLILLVADQRASAAFFRAVLAQEPVLDEPGMTEFTLTEGCVLGLMPRSGIARLLDLPHTTHTTPSTELYLQVDDPERHHARALGAGARELSALAPREWGDEVAYSLADDGVILAFARRHRAVTTSGAPP